MTLTFVFFLSLQFLKVLAHVYVSLSSKMFSIKKVSSKLKSSCVRKGNTATIRKKPPEKKPVSLISASDNLQEPLLRKSVGKVTSESQETQGSPQWGYVEGLKCRPGLKYQTGLWSWRTSFFVFYISKLTRDLEKFKAQFFSVM